MTSKTGRNVLYPLLLAAALTLGLSCSDDDNNTKKDQGVADLATDGSSYDLPSFVDQMLPDMSAEDLPVIEQILPDNGPTDATTQVVLLGKNFKHPVTVYVNGGEDIITDTSVASDISMSFTMKVSPNPDKTVPVQVRVRVKSGGAFSNSVDFQYTVTDPMSDTFKGSLRTSSISTYRDFQSDAIEGQVYVDPADPASDLVAEVGLGPDGTSPLESGSGWKWFAAEATGTEGDYQLFAGSVVAYLQQPYDLAYRFSKDGGQRWIYADKDESNLDYEVSQAGALTVELAPDHYCQKNDDCLKYTFDWACDLKSADDSKDNRCVQCLADADCSANPNALGPRCEVSQQTCYCESADDCTGNDHGQACTEDSYCGCGSSEDCISPKECFQDEATGLVRCMTPQ